MALLGDSGTMRKAFLFPGQGAQYVGMAKDVATTVPAAAKLFEQASEILGYDLLAVCSNGPSEELNSTRVCQPALFVANLADVEKMRIEKGPSALENVDVCAGLSLGEYTALAFAGWINFEEGVQLVQARGEVMQMASEVAESGMISVMGMEKQALVELCGQVATDTEDETTVANLLYNKNFTVSSSLDGCAEISARCADLDGSSSIRTAQLPVSGGFHSKFMLPAVPMLADALEKVRWHEGGADGDVRPRVLSNVTGRPHVSASCDGMANSSDDARSTQTSPSEGIKSRLLQQLTEPVRWDACMDVMLSGLREEGGAKLRDHEWWEFGPGRVLAGVAKRTHRRVKIGNIVTIV